MLNIFKRTLENYREFSITYTSQQNQQEPIFYQKRPLKLKIEAVFSIASKKKNTRHH